MRARYYDPSVGRFISEDTYKGQVDNPLSLNRYTYTWNNPLRYSDPTGHDSMGGTSKQAQIQRWTAWVHEQVDSGRMTHAEAFARVPAHINIDVQHTVIINDEDFIMAGLGDRGSGGGFNLGLGLFRQTGKQAPVNGITQGTGKGLTGSNWKFDPAKDLDFRGSGKSYKDGLDEAFKRTGLSRDQFTVTKWGKDANGKSVPVEWSGPGGANVNMDIPKWNNVKPNGSLGEGPHQPHIGYQTPGKGTDRIRGHIFVDDIPATRR